MRTAHWRIAIAVSEFNSAITEKLLEHCEEELVKHGVPRRNIRTVWVPGAYEQPYAAHELAKSKRFDAVICLGCIIKGETEHDAHIARWCSVGIGQVSLATGVPTLFGVLTPQSEAQAEERVKAGALNRGKEVAEAAIRMIELKKKGMG